MMLFLSGAVNRAATTDARIGFMHTPEMGNIPPLPPTRWACDTGLFSSGRGFDLDKYLRWLWERRYRRDTCLFATAPDVYGDWAQTWRRSAHVLDCIRGQGFPVAIVAQDGLDGAAVKPLDWDAFDVFFVGGTTEYKLAESTYGLVQEAKQRGKWCHMGRVNSGRRFRAARLGGYDSVDGTFLAFGPNTNLPRLLAWLNGAEAQPALFGTSVA